MNAYEKCINYVFDDDRGDLYNMNVIFTIYNSLNVLTFPPVICCNNIIAFNEYCVN